MIAWSRRSPVCPNWWNGSEALIAEVPQAEQIKPLAEHIYSFAQSGPRLMESLESVKEAVPQIETATQALGETAGRLQDTTSAWPNR